MRTMHIVTILPTVVTVCLMGCSPSLPVMDRIDPISPETAVSRLLPTLKVIEPPFLPPFSPDIVFHGPRFSSDGKLLRPARATVLQNGVLVQDNVELTGPTDHGRRPLG